MPKFQKKLSYKESLKTILVSHLHCMQTHKLRGIFLAIWGFNFGFISCLRFTLHICCSARTAFRHAQSLKNKTNVSRAS